MRFAIFTHKYGMDIDEREIQYCHEIDIYKITHTFDGAYCDVDDLYDKMVEDKKKHFLSKDVEGVLLTKEHIKSQLDVKEKTKVAYIEYGFLDRTHIDIWIQKLDELTQI